MPTNTIASELQLTELLDSAMEAYRLAIMPLTSFSTVFSDVDLKGDNTMTIPYYPLATSASQTRASKGSYKALATDTTTDMRQITINRNKVQAINFTSEEVARQPMFDPVRHGALKGEKLAQDIIADIFSVVTGGRFSGTTIAATAAANFDEDDVMELAQLAMEDNWPNVGRSLTLNPAFYFNLVKQPAILDASQSMSPMALREALVQRIGGWDIMGTNGMLTNNDSGQTFTGATTDICTAVAHGFNGLERVRLTTSNTLPAGLATATDYYVIYLSADTFSLATTPALAKAGTAVDITDTGTGTHTITKYENLAGIAAVPSAILTGFAPIPPTPAVESQLYDYRIIDDPYSDLVLEYKHIGYGDTDEEVQAIEAHYGYGYGEENALKRIITA